MLAAAVTFGLMRALHEDAGQYALDVSSEAGFVLRHLVVSGRVNLTQADLDAVLEIDTGMPLFAIDITALQDRIEGLGWVKRATVSRRLPAGLRIELVERTPAALWQRDRQLSLVDEQGVTITRSLTRGALLRFAGLPVIVGAGAADSQQELVDILAVAPALAEKRQSAIRVGERRWDIVFEGGLRVMLPEQGQDRRARAAFRRFAELEQQFSLLSREITVVDLRNVERMIVRLTPTGSRLMRGAEFAT